MPKRDHISHDRVERLAAMAEHAKPVHKATIAIAGLLACLPYALLIFCGLLVYWMAGAVLSITLGQIVLWAAIFAAGYAFGKAS